MSTLKLAPVSLRLYIRNNHIAEIYEALLSGICIMRPDNPKTWLVEKLRLIQNMQINDLEWNTFIDQAMTPQHPFLDEKVLHFLFRNYSDDGQQPSQELIALAYETYNTKLKKACLHSWLEYHYYHKINLKRKLENLKRAETHYVQRKLRIILTTWNEWTQFRLKRQAVAYQLIQRVYSTSLARIVFQAWLSVAVEARKTREYFERLERGENVEDDDVFNAEGDGEARDDVSKLERNVSTKIFGYLNLLDLARCAGVCRAWKLGTQNHRLWSKLDFTDVSERMTDKVSSRLLYRCHPYLLHVNMKGCNNLGRETFVSVGACRNLQDINLSECESITDEGLHAIVSGCRLLLYLNLSFTSITDISMRNIAKYSTNLQYLSVAFCDQLTDNGLMHLSSGAGCKKIVHLDLSGCAQFTDVGFSILAEACQETRHWILNDLPDLNDSYIVSIATHCPYVESLELLNNGQTTDDALCLIARRSLRCLKVDSNPNLSDLLLKALGRHCNELRHLYIADCPRITDAGLKAIGSLRNLAVVNFADCIKISDPGVRNLVEGLTGPKLRELNLTNCLRVSDNSITFMIKRCPNLVYLSVCYCSQIGDLGLEALGSATSIVFLDLTGTSCGDVGLSSVANNTHLHHLILSDCPSITDLGLQKLAQQCRNLEYLDVSMCYQLTDGAIKSLAFCCRFLTNLNLAGCKQMTDLCVQYVSGVCRHLRRLNLNACVLITDKSLRYLKKGCKKLEFLSILHCKGIPKAAVLSFASKIEARILHSMDDLPEHYCTSAPHPEQTL